MQELTQMISEAFAILSISSCLTMAAAYYLSSDLYSGKEKDLAFNSLFVNLKDMHLPEVELREKYPIIKDKNNYLIY